LILPALKGGDFTQRIFVKGQLLDAACDIRYRF
jgi:hypothetical protein